MDPNIFHKGILFVMGITSAFLEALKEFIILSPFVFMKKKKRAGRRYKIPEFDTLFPHKINEFVTSPKQCIWLEHLFQFSEMNSEEFEKIKGISSISALFYPLCGDIQRYEILFKIIQQTFVADDLSDKINDWKTGNKRDLRTVDSIWRKMAAAYDKCIGDCDFISLNDWRPVTVYFYMVLDSLFQHYNKTQKKRFRNIARATFKAQRLENSLILSGKLLPTFQEYFQLRKLSSGIMFTMQLIEFADNIFLSEEDWNNPLFQEVMDFATGIIAMDNDIYSFEKEFKEGNYNINDMCLIMVAVVVRLNSCSIEEAIIINRVRLIDLERICFEKIHKLIASETCSDTTQLYLKRAMYLIGGNHYLSKNATRYNYP